MNEKEKLQDGIIKILLIFAVLMLVAQFAKLPILFAFSMPLVIVSWMCLGAARKGTVGRGFKSALTALYLVWTIGFIIIVTMDHSVFTGTIMGHTTGAAIMIYAIWILPFFIISLFFGKVFDREYITSEDVVEFERNYGEDSGYAELLREELICKKLAE